jgi:hypothetical protein
MGQAGRGLNAEGPSMTGVTTYKEETALIICDRLAEGESLKSICEDDGMPARSTVFKWLAENTTFSDMYARAREEQADAVFDEILSIADDGRNDWMERRGEEDAGWVTNGENLQRSKLRIDARKWMAGKLRPKKYGDKLDIEHSGDMNVTFQTVYEAPPEKK